MRSGFFMLIVGMNYKFALSGLQIRAIGCTKVSKKALNPPFLQTAVVRSAFYLISLSFLKASFVEFNRITGNSSIFVSSFPIFVAKK